MPNTSSEIFEKALIVEFEKSSSFVEYKDKVFYFKIERFNHITNDFVNIVLPIEFNYDETTQTPKFIFKNYRTSILYGAGHIYNDGVLCHNIPFMLGEEDNAKWYARSIIEYIRSLQPIAENAHNFLLRSLLPEEDLVTLEKIYLGNFFLILDTNRENIKIGDKYRYVHTNMNVRLAPNYFMKLENQNTNAACWKVTLIDDKFITLKNTHNQQEVKTIFQPLQISEVENTNKKINYAVLGCGSLGSYFITNLVKDYLHGNLTIIDGDIYLYNNCDRHAMGYTQNKLFRNKGASLIDFLTRETLKKKNTINLKNLALPIGLRTHSDSHVEIQNSFEDNDVIVDLTGSDSVLKETFNSLKNRADKTFYKAALYDGGNVMIMAKIDLNSSYEKTSKQWEELRVSKGVQANSAYSNENPANNTRVSLCASVLLEMIVNNKMKAGEIIYYDWRNNIK